MALDFFAGSVAGAAGVLAGHPLDTVKVRLQTQTELKYKGMTDCIRSMVAEEGAWSMYKGITSPLAGLAAVNAIIFGVQGSVLRALPNQDEPRYHFVAGSVAGLAQALITSPMELVKTRLQIQGQGQPDFSAFSTRSQTDVYKGPIDCAKQIYRQGGMRGMMKGLGPTVARDAPAFGLYFYSYETLTRWMDPRGSSHLPGLHLLFAGGMAGVVSWVGTYPIDVVKSRLQADGVYRHTRVYDGAWDCAKKTVATEGLKSLTTGLNSAIARAFVLNAVTFYTVEWVFKMHQQYVDEACSPPEEAAVAVAKKRAAVPSGDSGHYWDRYHFHLPLPEAGATSLDPHISFHLRRKRPASPA